GHWFGASLNNIAYLSNSGSFDKGVIESLTETLKIFVSPMSPIKDNLPAKGGYIELVKGNGQPLAEGPVTLDKMGTAECLIRYWDAAFTSPQYDRPRIPDQCWAPVPQAYNLQPETQSGEILLADATGGGGVSTQPEMFDFQKTGEKNPPRWAERLGTWLGKALVFLAKL
ncbi:hypothetical protein L6258_00890, partial [Candidatus Parcubacteria bacterium]|nr:hypothetical protein [Candidatus Parcubacteria bacterium]